MTTRIHLQFLDQMLREAEQAAAAPTSIIPSVVDWFAIDIDLIETIIRHHGGVLMDAAENADGVVGDVEGGLKARIESLPIPQVGATDLRVQVVEAGAQVVARFEGHPIPTNPAHRTVLGLVAALFAAELREQELGVLAWDETRLDQQLADWCWELVTHHLEGCDLGAIRCLIPMTRVSSPSILRHCTGEVSARFVVSPEEFWPRKPTANNTAAIRTLAGHPGPLVLFLGAGFATSSGLPTGEDLMTRSIQELTGRAVRERAELARAFAEWLRANDRVLGTELADPHSFARELALERVLREEWTLYRELSPTLLYFDEKHSDALEHPGRAVRKLVDLCTSRRDVVIVTVNFDELIEHTFDAADLRVFSSSDDFESAAAYLDDYLSGTTSAVPLLKLHGTWSDPDTLVFRQEQTAGGLPPPQMACLEHLRQKAPPTRIPWLYVGTSMRDRDIVAVLGRSEYTDPLDEWWVAPLPASSIRHFAEVHRGDGWAKARRPNLAVRLITEIADAFVATLADAA